MKQGNYRVEGRVHYLGDIEQIQTKRGELLKRTLVLEVPVKKGIWNRTTFAAFDTFNEKVYQLEEYDVGDDVEIDFYIKSNQGKKDPSQWFTSLYINNIYRNTGYWNNENDEKPKDDFKNQDFEQEFDNQKKRLDEEKDDYDGKYSDLIPKKPEKFDKDFDLDPNDDDLPF